MTRWCLFCVAVLMVGCSGEKPKEPEKKGAAKSEPVVPMAGNTRHPLARYIEVAGFRMSERSGGKLAMKMVVVNHSHADINELALEVNTPACVIPVKVGALAPEEAKDVTAECTTTLRVYELPDWQFIRPAFTITAPTE